MKFKIHFTRTTGSEDNFILEGETVEEIRENAKAWIKSRGLIWEDAQIWSEEL